MSASAMLTARDIMKRKLIKVRLEFRIRFWELGKVFCELRRESAREMLHEPFKGIGRVTHKLSLLMALGTRRQQRAAGPPARN